MPSTLTSPGRLVSLRGREWVVMPSDDAETLLLKPLGGSDEEITGIYLPLGFKDDEPSEAEFPAPKKDDLGAFSSARLLLESARLAFRNGAGPFRCLAKLSFRARAYQMVPLIMALRHEPVRLLVADDVGVGKTIEALLIARELLERRVIRRFAVLCLPHLCDQCRRKFAPRLVSRPWSSARTLKRASTVRFTATQACFSTSRFRFLALTTSKATHGATCS